MPAITWGLVTMIAIIVAMDQMIWRPVIAWSDKFKFEQVESATHVRSPMLHLLHELATRWRRSARHTTVPLNESGLPIGLAKRRRNSALSAAGRRSPERTHESSRAASSLWYCWCRWQFCYCCVRRRWMLLREVYGAAVS